MKPLPPKDHGHAARFMRLVRKNEATGCWVWQGTLNDSGYGIFTVAGQSYLAHRIAGAWLGELDLAKLYACHRCDNPPCVNPGHLFAGTAKDNSLDMLAKGRHGAGCLAIELEPRDAHAARAMLGEGRTHADVADYLGISVGDLHRSLRNTDEFGFDTGLSLTEEFDYAARVIDEF